MSVCIVWRCAGTSRCSRAAGATRFGCTTWQREGPRRASRPSRFGWRTARGTEWHCRSPARRPLCTSTATSCTGDSSHRPIETSLSHSSRYGSVRETTNIPYSRLIYYYSTTIWTNFNYTHIVNTFFFTLQGALQEVRLVSGPHGYLAQCPGLDSECPTCGQFALLQATVQELTTHIHDLSLKVK